MSRIGNNATLICYDITSNKLRRKIELTMKDFGVRIQFSVFLCYFDPAGLQRCRDKLNSLLLLYSEERESTDSLIIFDRLYLQNTECLLGKKVQHENKGFKIY